MTDFLVGTFGQWNPKTKKTSGRVTIYDTGDVFIGRDLGTCRYFFPNRDISNRHLRIYTVVFDHEQLDKVPPLVFAQDLSTNGTLWNGHPIDSGHRTVLLSHGDILSIAAGVSLRFEEVIYMKEPQFSHPQQSEIQAFKHKFVITPRVLGTGAHGRVHMAYRAHTAQQLACKVVDLMATRKELSSELQAEQESRFFAAPQSKIVAVRMRPQQQRINEALEPYKREAKILAQLSHPNIIAVEKAIQADHTIYIFTELMVAGDLFSYVRYKGGRLNDISAAAIVYQLLFALAYLHDRYFVHRDVKPDNILITSLEDCGRVVLTDFGCAIRLDHPDERMSDITGTRAYCAPEMHESSGRGYGKAVDLWALGCVTAVLLVGYPPFDEPYISVSRDLKQLEADMLQIGIDDLPEHFVFNLLEPDDAKRITAKQAMNHSWLTNLAIEYGFYESYRQFTRDWRPRSDTEPVVVDIDSLKSSEVDSHPHPHTEVPRAREEHTAYKAVGHISESS